jgi:hypothetical protein
MMEIDALDSLSTCLSESDAPVFGAYKRAADLLLDLEENTLTRLELFGLHAAESTSPSVPTDLYPSSLGFSAPKW